MFSKIPNSLKKHVFQGICFCTLIFIRNLLLWIITEFLMTIFLYKCIILLVFSNRPIFRDSLCSLSLCGLVTVVFKVSGSKLETQFLLTGNINPLLLVKNIINKKFKQYTVICKFLQEYLILTCESARNMFFLGVEIFLLLLILDLDEPCSD